MAKRHSSVTLDRVMDMVREDDNMGICGACGEDAYGVEPDLQLVPLAEDR